MRELTESKVASLGRVWVRFSLHKSWSVGLYKNICLYFKTTYSRLDKLSRDDATLHLVLPARANPRPSQTISTCRERSITNWAWQLSSIDRCIAHLFPIPFPNKKNHNLVETCWNDIPKLIWFFCFFFVVVFNVRILEKCLLLYNNYFSWKCSSFVISTDYLVSELAPCAFMCS